MEVVPKPAVDCCVPNAGVVLKVPNGAGDDELKSEVGGVPNPGVDEGVKAPPEPNPVA